MDCDQETREQGAEPRGVGYGKYRVPVSCTVVVALHCGYLVMICYHRPTRDWYRYSKWTLSYFYRLVGGWAGDRLVAFTKQVPLYLL